MGERNELRHTPSLSYAALQRLHTITTELLRRLELDPLLESILEGAVELLRGDHGHLYRYDPKLDQLVPWIPHGLPDKVGRINLERGEGAAGKVLDMGEPLVIDDYDTWKGRTPKWPRGLTGPVVIAPIRARDEIMGVVGVNRRPGEQPFAESAVELLELFANQAAVAISNAQAYEATRRSADELSRLYEVSLAVAGDLDLERVLETILDGVVDLLEVRSANVRIYDENSGLLVPLLPYKQSDEIAQIELKPGEGLSGKAFSDGEPVVVNDYDTWEGRSEQYRRGIISRTMAVPLVHGDRIIGAIAIDRVAEAPSFDENDVRLFSLFANQAALAIVNGQLYEQARRRGRELEHVYETSLDITSQLDLKNVLEAVIDRTRDLVGAAGGELIVIDPDTGVILDFLSKGLEGLISPAIVHRVGEIPTGLDGMVIDGKEAICVNDYDSFQGRVNSIPSAAMGPMVGIPILHHGEILGSLSLFRPTGEAPFTEKDVRRLSLFANQAAVAIANARQVEELSVLHLQQLEKERLDQQLQMASAVQGGFLPTEPPDIMTLDAAAFWEPALQIGGDFYDFIELEGGEWGLVVADVSDKGIPAALFMSMARSLFRSFARRASEPAQILTEVNQEMLMSAQSGMFVTAIFAIYDPGSGDLRLSNGGHNRPLLLRAGSDHVEIIDMPGTALGVIGTAEFETFRLSLRGGDRLLLYTDGVTEAINQDRDPFGLDRLRTWMIDARTVSSHAALRKLKSDLDEFCEGLPPFDDLTCVMLNKLD